MLEWLIETALLLFGLYCFVMAVYGVCVGVSWGAKKVRKLLSRLVDES